MEKAKTQLVKVVGKRQVFEPQTFRQNSALMVVLIFSPSLLYVHHTQRKAATNLSSLDVEQLGWPTSAQQQVVCIWRSETVSVRTHGAIEHKARWRDKQLPHENHLNELCYRLIFFLKFRQKPETQQTVSQMTKIWLRLEEQYLYPW